MVMERGDDFPKRDSMCKEASLSKKIAEGQEKGGGI